MATFSGSITFPILEVSGDFEELAPHEFSGAITFPLLEVSGGINPGNEFAGAITLPGPNNFGLLISDPSGDPLESSSNDPLGFGTKFVRGTFEHSWGFSGNIDLPLLEVSGEFKHYDNRFSGNIDLPLLEVSGTFAKIPKSFSGAITLPLLIVDGSLSNSHIYVGDIVLPLLRVSGRFSVGVPIDSGYVIFTNFYAQSFTDEHIDTVIQDLIGLQGADLFDAMNVVQGNDPNFRSITVRRPIFGNQQILNINPNIHTTLSGQNRTYIDVPLYKLAMTWELIQCETTAINSLLGLIYFNQIRMIIDGAEWSLCLMDDVAQAIYQSRNTRSVTLNFVGKKLI